MKLTIYGCMALIIGTMFLLVDITLFVPIYFIGIILLISGAMTETNNELKEVQNDYDESSLIHLRDIEVLSNEELEESIILFGKQPLKDNKHEEYLKYQKIINELQEKGYFTDEILREKIKKLKIYYKIDY